MSTKHTSFWKNTFLNCYSKFSWKFFVCGRFWIIRIANLNHIAFFDWNLLIDEFSTEMNLFHKNNIAEYVCSVHINTACSHCTCTLYNNIFADIQNPLVPETHLNITKVKTEPNLFLWQVQRAIVEMVCKV